MDIPSYEKIQIEQENSGRDADRSNPPGQEMNERGKVHFRLTLVMLVLLFYLLALFACAPAKVRTYPRETRAEKSSSTKPSSEKAPSEKVETVRPFAGKTYAETISEWKSYQDLARWMEKDFSFDSERYKKFEGTLPVPRTAEETFRLRSGIYIDAVEFSKKTLNQISPSYKPQAAIIIVRPNIFNHYVCVFRREGMLFVLDYGTPYREMTGVHGPYHSLDEYKRFYEKHHPEKRKVEGIRYLP